MELLGWLGFGTGVVALILSSLSLILHWITARKTEERDLTKERNDLLDTALITKQTLQNMKFKLDLLPWYYRDGKLSANFEKAATDYRASIQNGIDTVEGFREQLKAGPLTAKLLDELSIEVREHHLHFSDFAPKVDDFMANMIEISKMTDRIREAKD